MLRLALLVLERRLLVTENPAGYRTEVGSEPDPLVAQAPGRTSTALQPSTCLATACGS